ncbi:MAG: hypothetical protein HC850_02460 [Rhodomicrobium sp.]|nr:hypothetical protein [Rhodomicrobium sp.]
MHASFDDRAGEADAQLLGKHANHMLLTGALAFPKVKQKLGSDRIVAAGTLGTAAVLILFIFVPDPAIAAFASAVAGVSWIAVLSTFHVSAQTALPDWVRARGLSILLTVFFGAMSGGSLIWGQVASMASIETSLLIAAGGAILLIPLTWRAKLNQGEGLDLAPSMHWPEPMLADETAGERGPVMVEVVYNIAAVNGGLKLTHFCSDRRLQSDPPFARLCAWPGGIDGRQSTFSFVLFGRAMMPARRLSFRR